MNRKTRVNNRTFYVSYCELKDMPTPDIEMADDGWEERKPYERFYRVQNWGPEGTIWMYLAEAYYGSAKEIHVFFPNGRMWISYGKTLKDAIKGAMKDGWMYARPVGE